MQRYPDAQQILETIRSASREMIRELGFLQDSHNEGRVTHSQCHSLIELERHGTLALGQLAELLRLDKSVVSRAVAGLIEQGLVGERDDKQDRRRKLLHLTEEGRARLASINEAANGRVAEALAVLGEAQQQTVAEGLALYAAALAKARRAASLVIRPIEEDDDPEVAAIIRTVMPEFGAVGPGYAINDPEVDTMTSAYRGKKAKYWVVEKDGRVVGGGGFAPLKGGDGTVCEVQKMYFLPEARGLGIGDKLLAQILREAKAVGFSRVYLETLEVMTAARKLYARHGFEPLCAPLGATGHSSCDAWYARPL